jgi:hypothetical protein
MAGSVVSIEAAYATIATSDKPGKAFADFENQVDAWTFDDHELVQHCLESGRGWKAIRRTKALRHIMPGFRSGDYFAGSGIIVAADQQRFLAADYRMGDGDPVSMRYGGEYRKMALVKVGRAALAYRLTDGVASYENFVTGYAAVEAELKGQQDSKSPHPHTIGYAWTSQYALQGIGFVGASGMIASPTVQKVTETLFPDVILRDKASGLVDWEGDFFAGYHDQVAASGVAYELGGIRAGYGMPSLVNLDTHKVNLH